MYRMAGAWGVKATTNVGADICCNNNPTTATAKTTAK